MNLDLIWDNTMTFQTSSQFPVDVGQGFYTSGYQTLPHQKVGLLTVRWKPNVSWISSKLMNRAIKSINGNRTQFSNLNIIHWNGGARKWVNKKPEIECLLAEKNPDVCFLSEANLWDDEDFVDRDIPGYRIMLPNTLKSLKHARLIALVKSDLNANFIEDKTNKDAAMVWMKIGTSKKNSILLGGIYRQHQLLGQADLNLTNIQLQHNQEKRWVKIFNKWKTMSTNTNCVVLGDINLDYMKWALPDNSQEKMVNEVKSKIETSGFQQLITGATRIWKEQNDSCIDHIWANCQNRIVKTTNTTRGSSDHNIIGVEISIKEIKNAGNNIVKRTWKKFDKEKCMQDFKSSNWLDIMGETNVNVAVALLGGENCKHNGYPCSLQNCTSENSLQ